MRKITSLIKKNFLYGFFGGAIILSIFLLFCCGPKQSSDFLNFEQNLPPPGLYPKKTTNVPVPYLTAKSVVVLDVESGATLFEKNSAIATSPASTTKIMTGLIALENYQPQQIIKVGNLGNVEGQKMKLLSGEEITFKNLLYGLLVASANDAALVLAQNFPLGEIGFVWAMNQKAKELKLGNSHFTNPVGYDDPDHYTSALDLARLATFAMAEGEFREVVGTEKITVFDINGKISHSFSNINTLVGKLPGVRGVKTGWTQIAGECLVTYLERNGQKIVVVVLGSQDRFKETEVLIDWIFNNFTWESLPESGN